MTMHQMNGRRSKNFPTLGIPVQETTGGPKEAPARSVSIKLRPWEICLAVAGVLLAAGVSTIGLVASYTAVEAKAAKTVAEGGWGWEHPWMLPVAVDLSILAFGIVNLLLVRFDIPAAWVKWVPRALTGLTVWLNWEAGVSTIAAAGHAGLAVLWVVFSELAAHLYAAHIGALKGRKPMEGVRFSRWILDPLSTAVIARQMKLWEITSYPEALELHKDRKVYRERLTQRHGKGWKKDATPDELLPLKLAKYGVTVAEALARPAAEAAAEALRVHDAGVRERALRLRVEEEEATEALVRVERKAAIDAAKAKAEAARLLAEAEKIKAEEEARTAADAVVRAHEAQLRIREAEAAAETERLKAEAEAKAAKMAAEAEAEAAAIRSRTEESQLRADIERRRLAREAAEQDRLAELETAGRVEEARAEIALAAAAKDAELSRIHQERAAADKAAAEAARDAAVARERESVAAKNASVAQAEALVAKAEAERQAAEEKRVAAAEAATAAELEKAMAVALEAASVAAASSRRSPAEREAYKVAEMIELFGEKKVTLRYITEVMGVPHSTAQDRRNRARQILAEKGHTAVDGESAQDDGENDDLAA